MKKLLMELEKKYGSKIAAAEALGITWRHFYRIQKEGEVHNKTLEKLIRILAAT
jgi:hypothetical protein